MYKNGVILEDGTIMIYSCGRAYWKRHLKNFSGKKCFSSPIVKQLIKDSNKELQGK